MRFNVLLKASDRVNWLGDYKGSRHAAIPLSCYITVCAVSVSCLANLYSLYRKLYNLVLTCAAY